MQQDPKNILMAILTIIGYEDDKEIYAQGFIQNCEKQAVLDLLTPLPPEKQYEFKQQLVRVDQEQQQAIIATYITPEQYREALQKASQTAFIQLLNELMPSLSQRQIAELQEYLKSWKLNASSQI